MSHDAKKGLLMTGPSQEVSAASGATAATVPQQRGPGQQGDLFPTPGRKPIARPLVLITRGRVEYLAHCPQCTDWHRHVHLGDVTGPCGTEYELRSRRGRAA
ncbi:hypothetical protein ACIQWR_28545 [Streptomyces sp. NPDC098789]|uniref:hypothetical protein n=1 Tax=Streptomyces sp. NPDC098789 TaxID=3366098 RepID=UPI00382B9FCB